MAEVGHFIEPAYALLGVRHWYAVQPNVRPRLQVYRYLGRSRQSYWFKNVRTKAWIAYSPKQLSNLILRQRFKCFCFDMKRLDKVKEGDLDANLRNAMQKLLSQL